METVDHEFVDLAIDHLEAGFFSGWFRARGIWGDPSLDELLEAADGYRRYREEAEAKGRFPATMTQ